MSKVAIKAENISKAYQLGQIGTGTISRDLERWWARTRGKEDPFLKIGEANDRAVKGNSDVVWSLKDINFEIQQGDAVGIIGRNGAGKSTLLKILSKVTSPTTGQITGVGRIASLLEVGTGFHPELTGRENIFLNGAILGMRKAEIKRKFDEIVDFSGVERYIDTPVKRYSSGMYVRLAFAVAAYLESEILIVDEVLAVGDAEFQKKCLGKMGEVSKGEGRTVLFVSHNMGSIQQLCQKCLLLRNGQVDLYGINEKVIEKYMGQEKKYSYLREYSNQDVYLSSASLDANSLAQSEKALLNVAIQSKIACSISLDIRLIDNMGVAVGYGSIGSLNYEDKLHLQSGDNSYIIGIDTNDLALGKYTLSIDLTDPNIKYHDRCEHCINFEIIRLNDDSRRMAQSWGYGSVRIALDVFK